MKRSRAIAMAMCPLEFRIDLSEALNVFLSIRIR